MPSRYRVVTAAVLFVASLGFSGSCLDADPFWPHWLRWNREVIAIGNGEKGEAAQKMVLRVLPLVAKTEAQAILNRTLDSLEVDFLSGLDAHELGRLKLLGVGGKLRLVSPEDTALVVGAIAAMQSRLLRLGLWREQVKIGD